MQKWLIINLLPHVTRRRHKNGKLTIFAYMKRILVFVLVASITCCSGNDSSALLLRRAKDLMQERPDSALILLAGIDTTSLHSCRQKAEYSLAYVTALDKNYIDTTNTNLLNPALYYYRKHGTAEDKMKVYYYLGCLQSNAGDYPSACVSFNLAWIESQKTEDNLSKGMICSALSIAYGNNRLSEEMLSYSEDAYYWFSRLGDSTYLDNSLYLLAKAYHNNHLPEKADSLYALVSPEGKFAAKALLGRATNKMKVSEPEPEIALGYFNAALEKGARLSLDEWYQYVYALFMTGQDKAADMIMKSLEDKPDNVKSLWWKYVIMSYRGKYLQALDYLHEFSYRNDTTVSRQLQQSIYKAEKNQYRYEAEVAILEKEQTKKNLAIIVLASLFIVAAITLLFLYLQNRVKQANAMLERQVSDARRMIDLVEMRAASDLHTAEDKLLALRASFASVYQRQFSLIGQLYNTNLEMSLLYDRGRQAFANNVQSILAEIGTGADKQRQFESRINKDLDNVMSKLRADFKDFGEENFRFLSYCIVGFDASTIASIMCMEPGAVRTRKSRLRKRVLSLESPNRLLYEALLG